MDFATIFRIHLSRLKTKDSFEKNSEGDPISKQKMVEESLARLLQSLNFHETVSSDLVFDCITKIIAKQVSLPCSHHYGNMGCGVFKRGLQNQKDFCIRINIPKGNYQILSFGLMVSCQI